MNMQAPILNQAPGKTRTWFNFVHSDSKKTAEIRIMESIGGWDGVSASALSAQIRGLKEGTLIKLYLYSEGGDVLEGNEIFNALSEHKGQIEVEIGALCASIATVIACAGDKITMAKNGLFMIHDPWTWAMGSAEDFVRIAGIMTRMKDNIVKTYRGRTAVSEKLTEAEVQELMTNETWMTAEEALANGFIDEILDKEDEEVYNLRNRLDVGAFKNSAALLSRLPKESQPPAGAAGKGNQPEPEVPRNQQDSQPKPPTLKELYMKGKVSIFASAKMPAGHLRVPTLDRARKIRPRSGHVLMGRIQNNTPPGGTVTLTPEQQNQRITDEARELYKAKIERDKAIDAIVLKVRNRDKKDFGKLAAKAKQEDWSVERFSMALADAEEWDPVATSGGGDPGSEGSGIEVLGIVGIPKGSPGEVFIASAEYRALVQSRKTGKKSRGECQILTQGFSNLLQAMVFGGGTNPQNATTSAGLTSIEKLPGVVTLGVRPLMVKDLIAPGATGNTTIRYIQEQTFVNAATVVAEGGLKPAAAFSFVEVDSPVRKIAAYTKVTDELWADYLAVASVINQRLPYMVERTEEDEILNGDGTGQHLLGLLNTPGIQTQARGGDTAVDAIYKAMTKVRWGNLGGTAQGGFEPDGIVIHPLDWEAIRLSKDLNNQYFGGGPFTGAYGNGGLVQYEVLWGKPCAITPAITQGTVLVAAFRLGAQYFMRQGLTIESTNVNEDDFIKNMTTIRAEERLALAVYRPLVFCQVTGVGA